MAKSSGGRRHRKGKRKSTREDHEQGAARKDADYGGEKGDEYRGYPRRRPRRHKGPWPPSDSDIASENNG